MKNRTPLPVPSGTPQNGHSRNSSDLDMAARSPPNQSSKALCFVSVSLHRRSSIPDIPRMNFMMCEMKSVLTSL
jgi:hypothetical protein